MTNYQYQYDFSKNHDELYNIKQRRQKANKILAVLRDSTQYNLENLNLLDIGSSTGIMTKLLSISFKNTVGIDIDKTAVDYAKKNFECPNLHFFIQDSMNIEFTENSFDVINCSHIYEHVPDSKQLMNEIYRVLKPRGICFFAAGNRLVFMEAHYKLPFLSVVPKWLAHKYIRLFKKVDFYYETHLTYWGLKKLVSKFEINDYTKKIIRNPEKYYATEMVKENSLLQFVYLTIITIAYFICPTYIWILKKK